MANGSNKQEKERQEIIRLTEERLQYHQQKPVNPECYCCIELAVSRDELVKEVRMLREKLAKWKKIASDSEEGCDYYWEEYMRLKDRLDAIRKIVSHASYNQDE